MTTSERAFRLYVAFKRKQHERAVRRAAEYRTHGARHAYYLGLAAVIRNVLNEDLVRHSHMA